MLDIARGRGLALEGSTERSLGCVLGVSSADNCSKRDRRLLNAGGGVDSIESMGTSHAE